MGMLEDLKIVQQRLVVLVVLVFLVVLMGVVYYRTVRFQLSLLMWIMMVLSLLQLF